MPDSGLGSDLTVAREHAGELLEREAELAAIADLVDRGSGGVGGVLLVEGEAGVGKTSLLQAVEQVARDQPMRVLVACGGELERSFPFGVAAQLFAPAVAVLDPTQRGSLMSGAAALASTIVDPSARVALSSSSSGEALFARLHGLYWLCAGLAIGQPLVLVVDDAHWADEPSLRWLLFMARRLGDMPVTLVLGARPASAGDWPEPLVLLRDEANVSLIRPRALSEFASRTLIARLLDQDPEEAFCAACHRVTGGNPFLLTELIVSASSDGLSPTVASTGQIRSLAPEGIARSVVVRLGRLSHDAAVLARCVAVLGAEAELRHAAALAGLDVGAAAAAADDLAAAGLLDAGRPLRLIHPVVRTALYAELPEGERAQLHRTAARLLAGEDADLDAIAAHLLASEPAGDRGTIDLLLKAGERALVRGAPATAAGYLRRALAEPPPADRRALVLRRLGLVEARLGDPTAAEHVIHAMRLTSEPRQRAELAFDLSVGYLVAGRSSEAISTLERAVEETEPFDPDLRWRLEAQLISIARTDLVHTEVARRHVERIPRHLRGQTRGERLILAELACAAALNCEPVGEVADLASRAFGRGQLVAEPPGSSLSVLNGIWALALSEQHEDAMHGYDALTARAQRHGSPILFALVSSRRSQLQYLLGAIPDAIADAQASIDAGRQFGQSLLVGGLYARLVDALLEAGDTPGAEQALAHSGFAEEIPRAWQFFPLIQSRGRLRLAQGNAQAGIDDLLAADELLIGLGITNPAGAHCRSTAAVALAGLGRHGEAERLLADELAAARRFGAGGTLGRSLRAAGVIEGGRAGIEHLRDAVTHLERSPARLEHARTLADLGAALRRDGKRREAQQVLRQALDLADRCGGKAVAAYARAELLITGARPRRARIGGVEALTPSELRVAQLAAQGLTNRQIAQSLFVSHPTVVTHLSHCYQKLDIKSREQLARALSPPPAAEPT